MLESATTFKFKDFNGVVHIEYNNLEVYINSPIWNYKRDVSNYNTVLFANSLLFFNAYQKTLLTKRKNR